MGRGKGLTVHPISLRISPFAFSLPIPWPQIATVSSRNQDGQTLAHVSVMLGYLRLLSSLIEWGIDLNLTGFMGSTALHYVLLSNESACAVFLLCPDVAKLALDGLGRPPWDLNRRSHITTMGRHPNPTVASQYLVSLQRKTRRRNPRRGCSTTCWCEGGCNKEKRENVVPIV